MKRLTAKILSFILTLSTVSSLTVPTFAIENNSVEEVSIETQEGIETAREAYAALTPEAKAIFDASLVYDSKILEFHTTYVDQSFTPPAYMPKTRSAGVAADYMRILTLELDKIALPQNVTYVLKAMGASMVAAIADGTLPVGDILLAATTVSAVAIIAANWDDVAPKFDKIISAFQKAFSTVSSNITSAFAKIKSDAKKEADKANEKTDSKELEKIKNKIPDKLKDENGNVDLTKFKKRVGKGSNVGYQEDVTGQDWVIQKDRGANSGTGGHGSVWKLKTQKQFKSESGRIATLNENGKILRG